MFWFIIGIFVGSTLGIFCFALVVGGNRNEPEYIEITKTQTGRWETITEGQYYYTACSHCGQPAPYNARSQTDKTRYCPHCGALMEGDYELKD